MAQPQRCVRLCAQKDLEQKEKDHGGMKAKRCNTPPTSTFQEDEHISLNNNKRKPEEKKEKAKEKHTVSCVPPARQKVLKSTEEQELEKRMKRYEATEKTVVCSRSFFPQKQGDL